MNEINKNLGVLRAHHKELTRQQFKTLKGQIINGDTAAAMKGLSNILNSGKGGRRNDL